jgi:flagellar FliL protein
VTLKGSIVSASPEASAAAPKGKKKLLIFVVLGVLVLGAAGAGGFIYYSRAQAAAAAAAEEEGGEPSAPKAAAAKPKTPPTFLPLENMVVNLADPGGDRFAQVGVTLEVSDPKEAEAIKGFMPTIRNGILLAISQRTADELLVREGKEKLALDIKREISKPLGYPMPEDEPAGTATGKRKAMGENPVQAVLFSSFIVQ